MLGRVWLALIGPEGAATISSILMLEVFVVGATEPLASAVLSSNTAHPFAHAPAVVPAATVTRASAPRLMASDLAKFSDTCKAEDALVSRLFLSISVNDGIANAAKMPTIATTTMTSIKENPEIDLWVVRPLRFLVLTNLHFINYILIKYTQLSDTRLTNGFTARVNGNSINCMRLACLI
jgi:hypothetical protein